MSLVNEYLRKTQEGAPSTLEKGAVPPVLTRNKPGNNNRNLLRFAMLLGVVVVAAVVVIKFYPYFNTFMTAGNQAKSTEVAITKGDSAPTTAAKPAATPTATGEAKEQAAPAPAVQAEPVAAPPVSAAAPSQPAAAPPVPAAAQTQPPAVPQTPPAAGSAPAPETTVQDLQKVPSLTDNTSVMASAPQSLKEEKIKIVARDSASTPVSTPASPAKAPSQTSDSIPPFPADESFLGGYEGDYAPSAVVVTSKKVGTASRSGVSRENRSTKNLKSEQLFQLGLSAQKSGQFDEAAEYYLEGLKRDPSNVGMMANLSAAYLEQHKYKEAEGVLAKARKLSPSNSKILVNLGLLELGRNQPGKAKHWFSEAARINPYDLDALNNLAYLAQQENDLAGMETSYQKMVELSPDNPDVLLTYASLLERNNKFQEAIAIYQKAMEMPGIKNSASMKGEIRKRIRILSQY